MQIFLMRHGEAVPPSAWNGPDSSRPLTPIGLAKLEAVAKEMKRVGFAPACVITSPYIRAKQTAELISKELSLGSPIVCEELSAGAHNNVIRSVVAEYAAKAPILLVGHMPEIAIFGSQLTMEPSVMDNGLEPGEMLALEVRSLEKWGDSRVRWSRKNADWKKAQA